jgi:predicted Zn finger-like uncharacterized protein
MKFACDRCHTKYSIADEKVRQKILKIRCKTCENVLTIRDSGALRAASASRPAPAPPPPPAHSAAPPAVKWFLATNGQQDGPFGLAELTRRIRRAAKEDEIYVWNETFEAWKEPSAVAEVAAELRAQPAVSPPPRPVPAAPPPAPRPSTFSRSGVGASASPGRASVSASVSAVLPARAKLPGPGGSPAVRVALPAPGTGLLNDSEGGEDRTRIQSPDAALLADLQTSSGQGGTDGPVTEVPLDLGSYELSNGNQNGTAGSGLAGFERTTLAPPGDLGNAGLDEARPGPTPATGGLGALTPLFPGRMAAATGFGAPSAPVAQASALSASGLSKLKGLPGFLGRHSALKYVVTGVVLVVLVIVVAVIAMTSGQKGDAARVAKAAPPSASPSQGNPPDDAEEQARLEAEERFRSTVGATAAEPPPPPRNLRPSASRRSGPKVAAKPARVEVSPPPPPPVAPPPVGSEPPPPDGLAVSRRFSDTERKVAAPRTRPPPTTSGTFTPAQLAAVVNQQNHKAAVKSCYERALKRDERLRVARLDVTVNVAQTGSVKSVSVNAPASFSSVSTCIRDAVKRWRFPSNSEEYETSFPLLLQQGG